LPAEALIAHMVTVAKACAPTPFYIYAFASRSGYPLTREVVEAVGEQADNLKGMKVSEPNLERCSRFLDLGLEILIGSDPVVPEALKAGAAGAASALAGVAPREIRAIIDDPGPDASEELIALRSELFGPGAQDRSRSARPAGPRRRTHASPGSLGRDGQPEIGLPRLGLRFSRLGIST